MSSSQKFLQRCIELAEKAKEEGFFGVGSVVVKAGKILAEGREGGFVLPSLFSHAENVALAKAVAEYGKAYLEGSTLYTNVEPCYMCSYVIRQLKIAKVYYMETTPAGGHSSAHPILTSSVVSSWKQIPEVFHVKNLNEI